MAIMDWTNWAFVAVNLGFTAFNARIAAMNWRRQRDSDLPAVSVTISLPENRHLIRVKVDATNRSSVIWHALDARVRWPLGAKILSQYDVPDVSDHPGQPNRDIAAIDWDGLRSVAPMHLKMQRAGTTHSSMPFLWQTERSQEDLLVWLPTGRRPHRLSVHLRFESTEPVPRRVAHTVTRQLAPEIAVKTT